MLARNNQTFFCDLLGLYLPHLTCEIHLARNAGSHGVVDVAGVGAEVATAGPHGQRADGAVRSDPLRQRLVVEPPGERDVIGDGVHLAEQQVLPVLLGLTDHALRLVCEQKNERSPAFCAF